MISRKRRGRWFSTPTYQLVPKRQGFKFKGLILAAAALVGMISVWDIFTQPPQLSTMPTSNTPVLPKPTSCNDLGRQRFKPIRRAHFQGLDESLGQTGNGKQQW